ncbi:MAG: SDR family oxidoreductase [Bacteroidales bacterium]
MKTYLVTGGAGFIGSNLAGYLLRQGHHVRVLDNFSTGRMDNLSEFLSYSNFELIEGDLRDYTVVRKAGESMEFILHQGALPSVQRSVLDPVSTNEVNVLGTLHVLQSARENNVRRVVYASSSSVYGNNPILPKHEGLEADPLSPYAISKYTGEKYCRVFYDLYGLQTVSLRYFNVFGPRQDPSSQYSAVIPKFIDQIRRGIQPVIYGDGLQSRDFTYVENNIRAILQACSSPNVGGKVYNIACGRSYTLLELVKAINTIFGTDVTPVFEAPQAGDVRHSLADISRVKKDLGFTVTTGFTEGLKKTVEGLR